MKKPGPPAGEYTGKMYDPSKPAGDTLGNLGGTVGTEDLCDICGESTAFMQGKYPNRVAVDDGNGVDFQIQWRCAECHKNLDS